MEVSFRSDERKAVEMSQSIAALMAPMIVQAIASERDRCAKIAEGLNGWGSNPCPELAEHIAKVIRGAVT